MLNKYIDEATKEYILEVDKKVRELLGKQISLDEIREKLEIILVRDIVTERKKLTLPKIIFKWEGRKILETGGEE